MQRCKFLQLSGLWGGQIKALEQSVNGLWRHVDVLQQAIFETPANSIEDLNAKAGYWYCFGPRGRYIDDQLADDNLDARIVLSIYKGIRRLASA